MLDLGLLTWCRVIGPFNDDRIHFRRSRLSRRWYVGHARHLVRDRWGPIGVIMRSVDGRGCRGLLRSFHLFLKGRRWYGSFPLFDGRSQRSVWSTGYLHAFQSNIYLTSAITNTSFVSTNLRQIRWWNIGSCEQIRSRSHRTAIATVRMSSCCARFLATIRSEKSKGNPNLELDISDDVFSYQTNGRLTISARGYASPFPLRNDGWPTW